MIVAMPLYIHAMPGMVLKLFEQMTPVARQGKSMGFIVQAGFVETEQQQYLIRYFEQLTSRLHYSYLGTIQKGEFVYKIGLNSLPWSVMQGKNHAYKQRFAKPFQ